MAKTLLGSPVGRPTRTLIDPGAVTTKQSLLPKRKADKKKGEKRTAKHIVTTPDGKKPLAEERKERRQIVGIKSGELVRVRGDRDGKYVVMSDPQFNTRTENCMARGKVVTVDLLGPGGPVTVPLRFCTPFYGNGPRMDEQLAGDDTIQQEESSDE
jgi:hypothetical protein